MLTAKLSAIADRMPSIFSKVGNCYIDIYRQGFADDAFSGQSLVETKLNTSPIPAYLSTPKGARQDEGGRWLSYEQTVLQFDCEFDLKLTDKIVVLANDLSIERDFKINSIGWMGSVGIAYSISGEFDLKADERDGERQ